MPIVPKLPRLALSTLIITAVTVVFSPAKSADLCLELKGCAWKACEAEAAVVKAEMSNPSALPGARRHLSNIEAYCHDDKERVKILEEISKTRDDLAELERKRFKTSDKTRKLAKINSNIQTKGTHIQRLELALKKFD